MITRKISLLLLLVLSQNLIAGDNKPISVGISTNKSEILKYESVRLKISLVNTGEERIRLSTTSHTKEMSFSQKILYALNNSNYRRWTSGREMNPQNKISFYLKSGTSKSIVQHVYWNKNNDIFKRTGQYQLKVDVPFISGTSDSVSVNVKKGSNIDQTVVTELKDRDWLPLLSQGSNALYMKELYEIGIAEVNNKNFSPYIRPAKQLIKLVKQYKESSYADNILVALMEIAICSKANKTERFKSSENNMLPDLIGVTCDQGFIDKNDWLEPDLISKIYELTDKIASEKKSNQLKFLLTVFDSFHDRNASLKRAKKIKTNNVNPILEYKIDYFIRLLKKK